MKVLFAEHHGCFEIVLKAENLQEAAKLTRFGINSTKKLIHKSVDVYKDTSDEELFSAYLTIGKHKRPYSEIAGRK